MNKYQIEALNKAESLLGIAHGSTYPMEWNGEQITMIARDSWVEIFSRDGQPIVGVAVEGGKARYYGPEPVEAGFYYVRNEYRRFINEA